METCIAIHRFMNERVDYTCQNVWPNAKITEIFFSAIVFRIISAVALIFQLALLPLCVLQTSGRAILAICSPTHCFMIWKINLLNLTVLLGGIIASVMGSVMPELSYHKFPLHKHLVLTPYAYLKIANQQIPVFEKNKSDKELYDRAIEKVNKQENRETKSDTKNYQEIFKEKFQTEMINQIVNKNGRFDLYQIIQQAEKQTLKSNTHNIEESWKTLKKTNPDDYRALISKVEYEKLMLEHDIVNKKSKKQLIDIWKEKKINRYTPLNCNALMLVFIEQACSQLQLRGWTKENIIEMEPDVWTPFSYFVILNLLKELASDHTNTRLNIFLEDFNAFYSQNEKQSVVQISPSLLKDIRTLTEKGGIELLEDKLAFRIVKDRRLSSKEVDENMLTLWKLWDNLWKESGVEKLAENSFCRDALDNDQIVAKEAEIIDERQKQNKINNTQILTVFNKVGELHKVFEKILTDLHPKTRTFLKGGN